VHERVVIFATEIKNLSILRENDYRVWPDADFTGAGQSVGILLLSFDFRCRMIVKVRTVVVGVTVKARFPQSGSRKTDVIPIAVLIRHIHHHNHAIGWALLVPTMKSNKLGVIVNMINENVLAAQTPRHTRQVTPEGDQIPLHSENTMLVLNSGPVDGDFILEPAIFQ